MSRKIYEHDVSVHFCDEEYNSSSIIAGHDRSECEAELYLYGRHALYEDFQRRHTTPHLATYIRSGDGEASVWSRLLRSPSVQSTCMECISAVNSAVYSEYGRNPNADSYADSYADLF